MRLVRSPSWPGVAKLSLVQTAASNHDSCEFRSIMRTPRPDVSALHYSRPLFCLLHSFRPLLQVVKETWRRCYRCPTHGGIQHSLSFWPIPHSYHYPLSEKFLETRTTVTLIIGGKTQSSGRQLLTRSCLFRKTATVASPRGAMTSLATGF